METSTQFNVKPESIMTYQFGEQACSLYIDTNSLCRRLSCSPLDVAEGSGI